MTRIVREEKRRRGQRKRKRRRKRGVMKDREIRAERRVRRETGIGVVIEIGISLNRSLGESKCLNMKGIPFLLTLCVILTTFVYFLAKWFTQLKNAKKHLRQLSHIFC